MKSVLRLCNHSGSISASCVLFCWVNERGNFLHKSTAWPLLVRGFMCTESQRTQLIKPEKRSIATKNYLSIRKVLRALERCVLLLGDSTPNNTEKT